jgi:hypothetical protein
MQHGCFLRRLVQIPLVFFVTIVIFARCTSRRGSDSTAGRVPTPEAVAALKNEYALDRTS